MFLCRRCMSGTLDLMHPISLMITPLCHHIHSLLSTSKTLQYERIFQSGNVESVNIHTGPSNYVPDPNLRHSRPNYMLSQKLTQSQSLVFLPEVLNSLLPVSALRVFPLQLTQKVLLFSRTFSSSLSSFSLFAEVNEA